MSGKVENSKPTKDQNKQQNIRNIEVGKFYLIHDGSPSGHPGYIIWKHDNFNVFLAIKFGTSPNPKSIKFIYPIGTGVTASFIYKKPFLGKRKDFGKKSFDDMILSENDLELVFNTVDFKNPSESPNIKSKDRHNYKKFCKIKTP